MHTFITENVKRNAFNKKTESCLAMLFHFVNSLYVMRQLIFAARMIVAVRTTERRQLCTAIVSLVTIQRSFRVI